MKNMKRGQIKGATFMGGADRDSTGDSQKDGNGAESSMGDRQLFSLFRNEVRDFVTGEATREGCVGTAQDRNVARSDKPQLPGRAYASSTGQFFG